MCACCVVAAVQSCAVETCAQHWRASDTISCKISHNLCE